MQVKLVSIIVFSVLFSLLLPGFVYAQGDQPKVVSIPDENLAAAVQEMIGDSITTHTLLDLTYLTAQERGIENLTGLEHARNLRRLGLYGNAISDISPLSGLTRLTGLYISNNNISDISPLVELKQLTRLHIWDNNISDISPLVELKDLTALYIGGNPLSYASINTHIPALQAKGIALGFDARVPARLVKISESAQQGIVDSAFPLRFVVEVLDQGTRPFQGVPVTFTVTAGDGTLTAADRITDAMGQTTALLKLGRTVGTTTLRVTAAHISQSVEFTATAVLHSRPVYIPDANLRAKIVETLGFPPGETLTPPDMLKLRTLTANNADIRDLTGIQYASNLTSLSLDNNDISDAVPLAGLPGLTTLMLDNNRVSDVVPLAGLTRLTMLSLRNNWVSDMSPLVGLVQLKDSKNRYGLDLRGNHLSEESITTYIPMLQAAGVKVGFDSVLTESGPVVRLVYFLPRDRQPQPNINAKMDRLIKDTQKLYADEMERHGFGRKTFRFETDASGNAVVYHIKGKLTDRDYNGAPARALGEVSANFHTGRNTYIIALDNSVGIGDACGKAFVTIGGGVNRAIVLMPAYGDCFTVSTAAHELGHAFGLQHDFRNNAYIMSYGGPLKNELSPCAAEWLDVHRYFNTNRTTFEWTKPTIEMIPPSLLSPPNPIRLRFKVTSPNGLHQAKLLINGKLTACQNLNRKTNHTVDFTLSSLKPGTITGEGRRVVGVRLMVTDVHGIIEVSFFPVDIVPLLPPPQPVLIPDPNLAAAIRQEIGDSITTHTLLNLIHLSVPNSGIRITDLTGLEHAHYLTSLNLGGEYIQGQGNYINNNRVLAGLTNLTKLSISNTNISDVSPLANLKNLTELYLWNNNISDVSPLAGLTNLTELWLSNNNLSDISALASLTNLTQLYLSYNNISDVSPLANLKNLTELYLWNNNISDVSPLAGLTNLTGLYLHDNNLSDISALAGLTNLTELRLNSNNISDVSSLVDLTNLTKLWLNSNNISDVSSLAGLTNLTKLWLNSNNISDASPLADLAKLAELWLDSNNISDVSSLAGLTNLTELWLNSNNISDVSPLITPDPEATSEGLSLFLGGNPLSDASINTHIPVLQAKGINVRFDNRASAQDFAQTLEKITGPWLWMIAPTDRYQGGARSIDVDSLAAASKGVVTEADVAANGANPGDRVGDFVWTLGDISPTDSNNINECLNRIGLTAGDVDDHSAYALFSLTSDVERTGVRMRVGSDDAIKVWLNGEVVHKYAINRPARDFQDTFQVDLKKGDNFLLVKVSERGGNWTMFVGIEQVESRADTQDPDIIADVNDDGVVNIQDLVLVASRFGYTGQHAADVNQDGIVNIQDLVLVASELGSVAAAPSAWRAASAELPSRATVVQWLSEADRLPLTDIRLQRGIDWIQRLLDALIPKETALLANYPNPFNPETWIPYQLSEPAGVTVRIYSMKGTLVRTLVLGHQPGGTYHSKSRAAYWDGRNTQGEKVASGIYFYTLSADNFTATRRMLIRK